MPLTARAPVPTADIEKIGPEEARSFLVLNTNNRRLSRTKALAYASKMSQGLWLFTGQAHVILSRTDVLLNGQHTLTAVVESGVTICTVVVRGVDPDAFGAIDTGMKRTAGQVLEVGGVTSGTNLAALIRAVAAHDSLTRDDRGQWGSFPTLDPDVIQDTLLADFDAWTYALGVGEQGYARARKLGLAMPKMPFAAFVYIAVRGGADPAAVEDFVKRVTSDEHHIEGQPATTLRRWLAAGRFHTRNDALGALSAWVKCWNAYVEGRSLAKVYAWNRATTTDFPKVAVA